MPTFTELTDYHWMYDHLKASHSRTLVEHYDTVIESADIDTSVLRLIKSAIDISTHIVNDDPEQLSSQLYGRLIGYKGQFPQLDTLLDQIWNLPKADLLPIHPTMKQAGGRLIRTFKGRSPVAISNDYLISGISDDSLAVWNWKTGELIRTLDGHLAGITDVALSGDYAVSASSDKTLQVWNWKTGEIFETLQGHPTRLRRIALVEDFVISTAYHTKSKVWNWKTGKELRELDKHRGYVTDVAISDDFAVTSSKDQTLKVWNWKTGEEIRTLKGRSSIRSVALSGEFAITTSEKNFRKKPCIEVWNWKTGELIRSWELKSQATKVELSHEIAIVVNNNMLQIWNWKTGELVRRLENYGGRVFDVAVDGDYAISASSDGILKVWSWTENNTLISYTAKAYPEGENHLWINAWAVNNEAVFSAIDKNTIQVWNWRTNEIISVIYEKRLNVNHVATNGDHIIVTDIHGDGTVRAWNWRTGEKLSELGAYGHRAGTIVMGSEVAIFTWRYLPWDESDVHLAVDVVKVWNWKTGEEIQTFEDGHSDSVILAINRELVFSQSSDNNSLKVWNWKTGEIERILGEFTYHLRWLILNDDTVVAAFYDDDYDGLRVWNWKTGELLDELLFTEANLLAIGAKYGLYPFDTYSFRQYPTQHHNYNFLSWNNHIRMLSKETNDIMSTFTTNGRIIAILDNILIVTSTGRAHILHIKPHLNPPPTLNE